MTDDVFFPPYRDRARHWVSRSLEPIRRIGRAKARRTTPRAWPMYAAPQSPC